MKRNKLWSFALAGALAVSNLSAVAIPMTALAAQQAAPSAGHFLTISTATTDATNQTANTGTLKTGGTIVLHAETLATQGDYTTAEGDLKNMAATDSIKWSVEGAGYEIHPLGQGETALLSASKVAASGEFATVKAEYVVSGVSQANWAVNTDVNHDDLVVFVKNANKDMTDNVSILDSAKKPISTLTLKSATGSAGKATLIAESAPDFAAGVTSINGATYNWKSSDTTLLTVTATGKQIVATVADTGLQESKTVTVYCYSDATDGSGNNYYGLASIDVTITPASKYTANISPASTVVTSPATMTVGDTKELTASLEAENVEGFTTSGLKYKWDLIDDKNAAVAGTPDIDTAIVDIATRITGANNNVKGSYTALNAGEGIAISNSTQQTCTITAQIVSDAGNKPYVVRCAVYDANTSATAPLDYAYYLVSINAGEIYYDALSGGTTLYKNDSNSKTTLKFYSDSAKKNVISVSEITITNKAGGALTKVNVSKDSTKDTIDVTYKAAGSEEVAFTWNNKVALIKFLNAAADGVRADGVELDKSAVSITVGAATGGFNAVVTPYDTNTVANAAEVFTVSAESSDESVVKVANIAAPAKGPNSSAITLDGIAPGKAVITVTADDTINGTFTAKCEVEVTGIKSITISGSNEVKIGATTTLKADVDAYGDASKNVTWESSDTSVAKVDANGVVTGVKAGTAKITATSIAGTPSSEAFTISVVEKTQEEIKAEEAAAKKKADDEAAAKKAAEEAAKKAAEEEAKKGVPAGTTKVVSGTTYKGIDGTSVQVTKTANKKSVKIGKTVTVDGKTLKVTKIGSKAITGKKVKTATIDATNIKKAKNINGNMFKGAKNLNKVVIKGAKKGSKVANAIVKAAKKVNKNVKIVYKK